MSRNGSTKQKTRIIIDSKQQISGGIPGAQLSLEAQNASEPSVSLMISSGCPKSVRGVTSSLRKLPGLVWTAISIQWVCKMHQNAGYTMVSPWFHPIYHWFQWPKKTRLDAPPGIAMAPTPRRPWRSAAAQCNARRERWRWTSGTSQRNPGDLERYMAYICSIYIWYEIWYIDLIYRFDIYIYISIYIYH